MWACVIIPLAAHAEHHDEDCDNKGWGSSDSAQQQDLAVGRSREVQPVLHGGHVGALALTCSHTHSHSHAYSSCTLGSATVSVGSAGTEWCLVRKWSNLYKILSRLTKQRNQKLNIHGAKSWRWAAVWRETSENSCPGLNQWSEQTLRLRHVLLLYFVWGITELCVSHLHRHQHYTC